MGTNRNGSLRHFLRLKDGQQGDYRLQIRYTGTSADGTLAVSVNGQQQTVACPRTAQNEWRLATVSATLNTEQNTLVITNSGGQPMYIDQVIYQPADTEPLKYDIVILSTDNGYVTADRSVAAEGETVTLTVSAAEGYRLKELRLVNSVFYTLGKTIPVNDNGTVTFQMINDNMTLLPVFADSQPQLSDVLPSYTLNLANTLTSMPEGWRCVQENGEVHEYGKKYSQGARLMSGFTGYQGKALYWRNDRAEYGRQEQYPLTLHKGTYELTFAVAAWKDQPSYRVSVVNAVSNRDVATSAAFVATPNASGSYTADLSGAQRCKLTFQVDEPGQYVISFTDATGWGGMHEFLLLECRLKTIDAVGDLLADYYHIWNGCTAWSQVANAQGGGTYDLNKELPKGGLVYGDPNVYYTRYANLTGCDQLVIYGTPGVTLRVLLNRLEEGNGGGDQNGGALTELNRVIGTDGRAVVALAGYEFVHLNAIKLGWGSRPGTITRLQLLKGGSLMPEITRGDVNGDGRIDRADVSALVNHLIGLTPGQFNAAAADTDGDGRTIITDVVKLIDAIK